MRRSRVFRFKNFWTDHEEYEGIIHDALNQPRSRVPMFQIVSKIKAIRVALLKWQQSIFKDRHEKINGVQHKLGFILAQPLTVEALVEHNCVMQRLDQLLGHEEIYWRQGSCALWVKADDRNTWFFHQRAKNRRTKNSTKRIKNARGDWVCDNMKIENTVTNCFKEIFQTAGNLQDDEIIGAVDTKVTSYMNCMLDMAISDEEVQGAVFQMQPSKVPGPDGMNPFFFQKFWNIVEEYITNLIKNFQATGRLLKQINFTNVSLIPKTKQPEEVAQFRPISLCNVLFKIISKVFANRLEDFLPKIIS